VISGCKIKYSLRLESSSFPAWHTYTFAAKMKAIGSYETSVNLCLTTGDHVSGDITPYIHRCKSLRSNELFVCAMNTFIENR
jgi:hypothetical protein